MRQQDFIWFLDNYNELYKEFGHKYLVIKDKTILGAYDSIREAVNKTDIPLGDYIVQECNGNESAYTNYIFYAA